MQYSNSGGNTNVAIGINALNNCYGRLNIAIGNRALENNNSSGNIAIGSSSLRYLTSGSGNTMIGNLTGYRLTNGSNNVGIGSTIDIYATTNLSNTIAIGTSVIISNTNAIGIGYNTTVSHTNTTVINASGSNLRSTENSAFFVKPIRQISDSMQNILCYNSSTSEITYTTGIISYLSQTLSSVAPLTWTNGVNITISSNRKWKVDVIIQTNYAPSSSETTPFIGMSIALYTSTIIYGINLNNPSTTNNYIIAICDPKLNNNTSSSINASINISDIFDLSSDTSSSCYISFYPITWDNSNIGTMDYSVILTPIY
jgi:hypothetical protein